MAGSLQAVSKGMSMRMELYDTTPVRCLVMSVLLPS